MTSFSFAPSKFVSARAAGSIGVDTSIDTLADELVGRWDGAGAPASALSKAARLYPGFKSRHTNIRQDRRFVGDAAWLVTLLFALGTTIHASSLVELLIAPGEELARMVVAAMLLGLAGLGLSRTSYRISIQIVVMAMFSIIVIAAPTEAHGLAQWDIKAAVLGWAIVAAKAIRLGLDSRLDRAEALLLLKAAGCR